MDNSSSSRLIYSPKFTPELRIHARRDCAKGTSVRAGKSQDDSALVVSSLTLLPGSVRGLPDTLPPDWSSRTASGKRECLRGRIFRIFEKWFGRMRKPEMSWQTCRGCLRGNLQLILLLMSIAAGVGLGFGLRAADIHKNERKTMYVFFIGEIFLNMLKVVILPLIVSSLITGLAQMQSQASGRIGLRAVIFYFTTTLLAVILGIVLVTTIKPGKFSNPEIANVPAVDIEPATTADTFLDLIRNMFPPNIVQACVAQHRTVLKRPVVTNYSEIREELYEGFTTGNDTFDRYLLQIQGQHQLLSTGNSTPLPDIDTWKIGSRIVGGTNILGIVVFSIVFGITISRIGPKGKPLADFFQSLNDVMMSFVGLVMNLAPLGILFIVAGQILKVPDFSAMIAQLGMYFLTVMTGLGIHGFILLPLVYFAFTRKNPYSFLGGATRAFATGFATSSSSATLPITIECCEVNNGVDPRIARFVLPIGATINMDGTALYEAVAAIFVAQTRNVEMTFGKIVAVSITATAAAIGAAGVPQAGLVTLVMVLDAVGLPAEFVGTILAVDWLLDRFRTTINILGDVLGAGIVNHMCRGFLKEIDDDEERVRNSQLAITAKNNCTELCVIPEYKMEEKHTAPRESDRL